MMLIGELEEPLPSELWAIAVMRVWDSKMMGNVEEK
jgi:hypothetical protein